MRTAGNTDSINTRPARRNGGKKFGQQAGLDRGTPDQDAKVSLARVSRIFIFSVILYSFLLLHFYIKTNIYEIELNFT